MTPSESHPRRSRLVRIDTAVAQVEAWTGIALVVAILVTVLAQVVMRYVFARPNPWTEELSRFSFIWLSLIGASLAVHRHAHFELDVVVRRASRAARQVVGLLVSALLVTMLVLLLILGTVLTSAARLERSPALDLPMVWVYAALPVAVALMLFHVAVALTAGPSGSDKGIWAAD
jgi:TRAP-type C4-dicarboxylate transport system permease small subunit